VSATATTITIATTACGTNNGTAKYQQQGKKAEKKLDRKTKQREGTNHTHEG